MLIIEKLPTRYAEGSATVAANEVTVTPTDALWYGNVWGDDRFFLPSQPLVPPQRIETVNEDGTLTLAYPWPGDSATEEPYEIRYVGIIERSTAQTRRVLEQLGEVSAYYDVQVDTLADRDAFDARPAGFRVLVSDVGDGRAAIYSKASSVEADWTDPAMFSGPIGLTPEVTVGTTTTGAPGTPASVTATPTVDGVQLEFTIPAGEGFSAEGDYSGATAYVKGDVVQYQGSSWIALQATTGNTPPSLPTTNNAYWQLLARAGNDGAGTVTTVVAGDGIDVDSTDPTEPIISGVLFDEDMQGQVPGPTEEDILAGRVLKADGTWGDSGGSVDSLFLDDLTGDFDANEKAQARTNIDAYGKDNILGAVSQSGGLPTGAIIERGSNANGEYVRYADGTQICTRAWSITVTTTALGSIHRDAAPTDGIWTFPAVFSAEPMAIFAPVHGSSWCSSFQTSTTNSRIVYYSAATQSGAIPFCAIAIGRWF